MFERSVGFGKSLKRAFIFVNGVVCVVVHVGVLVGFGLFGLSKL